MPPPVHAGGRPVKQLAVGLVVELGAPPVAPPAVETLEQVVADSLLVKPPSLPLAPLLGKGAASWRRLNENHAQLVGEMCLHLAKARFKAAKLKYEKTLEELGFAFPPQQTLSEWKARVLLNQPARGVPGGNKVAILSVTERKQLIDALFGIGNAGAKVGLKLVKRLTTAILALSGKAYISGKNNARVETLHPFKSSLQACGGKRAPFRSWHLQSLV